MKQFAKVFVDRGNFDNCTQVAIHSFRFSESRFFGAASLVRTFTSGYGLALVFVFIALLLSLPVHRIVPAAIVYPFLFAVVASAWLGRGPGLFSTLLASLTLDFFFLRPLHTLGISWEAWPYVLPFLLSALASAWVSSKSTLAVEEAARLTCAIEQAADAIVITDNRARIQYANPALTRLTGYAPSEVIGQNPRILNSSRQPRSFYEDLWKTIRGGRIWRGRLINRRKDGTLYNEEMTIAPVRNRSGAVTNFVAIKQDVTERATKEELSSFLASLVESSGDSIIGCTPEGKILTWNHAAELLYGYPAEEVIGHPLFILVPASLADQLGLMLEKGQVGRTDRQL